MREHDERQRQDQSSPSPQERPSDQHLLLRLQSQAGNAAVTRLVGGTRALQRQPLELDEMSGSIWHQIHPPGHTLSGKLQTQHGEEHVSLVLDAGSSLLAKHGRQIS